MAERIADIQVPYPSTPLHLIVRKISYSIFPMPGHALPYSIFLPDPAFTQKRQFKSSSVSPYFERRSEWPSKVHLYNKFQTWILMPLYIPRCTKYKKLLNFVLFSDLAAFQTFNAVAHQLHANCTPRDWTRASLSCAALTSPVKAPSPVLLPRREIESDRTPNMSANLPSEFMWMWSMLYVLCVSSIYNSTQFLIQLPKAQMSLWFPLIFHSILRLK